MKKKSPAGNNESLLRRPPLYQQAADRLREKFRTMAPGTRLPAEHLLAAEYGISITTLREAVRILAAEGRVERKQGKGTFICEPAPEKAGWVALLIHHDISSPGISSVYLRLTQEVRTRLDAAGGVGVPSRLYVSRRPPGLEQTDFYCPEFFEDLEGGHVRGVVGILLAAHSPWFERLQERGILHVGFGHGQPFMVRNDIHAFYREAIAELLRRGRRRLGLITWGGYPAHRSRQAEAFHEVMEEAGLPVEPAWICDDLYPAAEGAGRNAFGRIWRDEVAPDSPDSPGNPDGLIVTDDLFLSGIAAEINERGIAVPAHLEIAALFSHDAAARYGCPVLAWEVDVPTLGDTLAEAVLHPGETPPRGLRLVPPLKCPESA